MAPSILVTKRIYPEAVEEFRRAAEDAAVRTNRLGLLQRIAALAHGAADLSRLEGF